MATVTLERISKVYQNGFEVVRGLDLSVQDGEFVVLVGPSGCGKTTTLRMVAGLEEITSGSLRIGDKVVNDIPAKERDIAMVFQNYALYPHMTVADNIGFALKLRKMPKAEIAEKVKRAGEVLGLADQLDKKPGQLSGGQRQRVAMGRAIVRDPAVFLMDEPLSNLDANLRVKMRAEVSRVQRQLGVATLYVTHDQVEAMTMGDRVAVMLSGDLQQCDKPQILYSEPANLFVAAFIGSPSMNLFEAIVSPDSSSLSIGSQSVSLTGYKSAHAIEPYRGRRLAVGFRPEHLSLSKVEDGNAAVVVADVDLVEALGPELLVYFRIDASHVDVSGLAPEEENLSDLNFGGSTSKSSSVGVARIPPREQVRPGERIRLELDVERLHFFDLDTGLAISNEA